MRYEDGSYVVESDDRGRITYRTPQGPKTIVPDKIRALNPQEERLVASKGANPEDYFACGYGAVLRNAARPVVEHALGVIASEEAEEKRRDAEEFAAAVASGEAFRVLEVTEQYGSELCWSRRFRDDEKPGYAEWYREVGLVGFSAGPVIKVTNEQTESVRQIVSKRPDGSFRGCSNRAWKISEGEWNRVLQEEKGITDLVAGERAARAAARNAIVIPDEAVEAYRRFKGSEDAAWDAEDEGAWSLLREFGDLIEERGIVPGGYRGLAEMREANRQAAASLRGEG